MSHSNVERIVIKDGYICTEIISKGTNYDERKKDITPNIINISKKKNNSDVLNKKKNTQE